jgi:hypothetical protein
MPLLSFKELIIRLRLQRRKLKFWLLGSKTSVWRITKKFLDASKIAFTPHEANVPIEATLDLGAPLFNPPSSNLGTPLEIGIPPGVKGNEMELNPTSIEPQKEGYHDVLEWLEIDRSKSFY